MIISNKNLIFSLILITVFISSCTDLSPEDSCGEDQKCFIDAMLNNCENKTAKVSDNNFVQKFEITGKEGEWCIVHGKVISVHWSKALEKTPESEQNFEKLKLLKDTGVICKVNVSNYIGVKEIGSFDMDHCEGSYINNMTQYLEVIGEQQAEKLLQLVWSTKSLEERYPGADPNRKDVFVEIKLTPEDIGKEWELNDSKISGTSSILQSYYIQKFYNKKEASNEKLEISFYYYNNEGVAKYEYNDLYYRIQTEKKMLDLGDKSLSFIGVPSNLPIIVLRKGLLIFTIEHPDINFSTEIANKILEKLE